MTNENNDEESESENDDEESKNENEKSQNNAQNDISETLFNVLTAEEKTILKSREPIILQSPSHATNTLRIYIPMNFPRLISVEDGLYSEYSEIQSQLKTYVVLEKLARGSFAQIYSVWDVADATQRAIKIQYKDETNREVDVLRRLQRCEYCLRIFDNFDVNSYQAIVFEKLDKTMRRYLENHEITGLQYVRCVAFQLMRTLLTLRGARAVHCDIKLDNVMFADRANFPYRVKIIDYNSAIMPGDKLRTMPPLVSRAPELILGTEFGPPIDLWSVACLLVRLYMGKDVFDEDQVSSQLRKIAEVLGPIPDGMLERGLHTDQFYLKYKGKWLFTTPKKSSVIISQALAPYLRSGATKNMRYTECNTEGESETRGFYHDCDVFVDFIEQCFAIDPSERIKPEQALEHRFLTMTHLRDEEYAQLNYVKCSVLSMAMSGAPAYQEYATESSIPETID